MKPSPQRRIIAFSNTGHAYTHLFLLLYPTVVLTLEGEFGLPYGELLALSLPGYIMFGAGAIPAGWLADRWSHRGMLALFFIGVGAAGIITGLTRSPLQLSLGLTLIGLFGSIYHPVGIALLVRHAEKRGRSLGMNGLIGNLGTASAGLVAGALTDFIHWRAAFIVPGIAAAATGLLFLAVTGGREGMGAEPPRRPEPEPSRSDLIRTMIVFSFALLCSGLIYQSTAVSLPKVFALRVTDMASSGLLGAGGLVTLVYIFASLTMLAGGHLADRFPLKPLYILAFVFQAPFLVAVASLDGQPLMLVVIVAVSLNLGAIPAETALIALYSPRKWQATAFGVKFSVSLGVAGLAVPLVALIHENTGGFYLLFMVLAGLAAALALAALFLPGARETAPAASGPRPGEQGADSSRA